MVLVRHYKLPMAELHSGEEMSRETAPPRD